MEGEKISILELSEGVDEFKLDLKVASPNKTEKLKPPPFMRWYSLKRLVSKSELKKSGKVPGFKIKWFYDTDVSHFDKVSIKPSKFVIHWIDFMIHRVQGFKAIKENH